MSLELSQSELARLEDVRSRWTDEEAKQRWEGYWVREMVHLFSGYERLLQLKRDRDLRRVRRLRGRDV